MKKKMDGDALPLREQQEIADCQKIETRVRRFYDSDKFQNFMMSKDGLIHYQKKLERQKLQMIGEFVCVTISFIALLTFPDQNLIKDILYLEPVALVFITVSLYSILNTYRSFSNEKDKDTLISALNQMNFLSDLKLTHFNHDTILRTIYDICQQIESSYQNEEEKPKRNQAQIDEIAVMTFPLNEDEGVENDLTLADLLNPANKNKQ